MRIISQNRKVNICYESIVIMQFYDKEIDKNIIAGQMSNDSDTYFVLGEYSTEERALEVMEEIKEKGHTLGTGNNWYQMPEV